ncbi:MULTISPECIES: cell division ATP-binding protein FtsE [Subtercola]|uniref:Cell division ATP-binding protein FtsE n=1 Tax=Subtercola vilae TaxID=2056433 RepID=A0A4T2BX93_9MICO|nr:MULTISPECIES: cell division ATP-binding protein FtsE [Subtercola]MEA9985280.1 cell division ATP-binding protein FtsE [Subtercola sp. RTI3]TIH35632.1 cell division ATP-binding protein FtsE [Subtercola vilae]
MIRFDHVSKKYKGTAKPALNTIDLEILRGEFVFLVGASGSGKSSFLRLVLKEDRPTSGNIHVLGQDLGSISSRKVPYFRRNLGVVFQDFRLLPNKNVFDNVAFTLQVIGKSRGFIQEAVPDVLQMVGLAEKANRLPHELSGGEQQRVAIARAVVNKPAILLADEPTGNLDPLTSAGIMNVLDRINAGGTTIIMATHDNAIVDQMQRRVIELVGGQIIRDDRQGGYGMTAAIGLQDSGMTAEITRPDPLSLRMQATGAIERPVLPVAGEPAAAPASTSSANAVNSSAGRESAAVSTGGTPVIPQLNRNTSSVPVVPVVPRVPTTSVPVQVSTQTGQISTQTGQVSTQAGSHSQPQVGEPPHFFPPAAADVRQADTGPVERLSTVAPADAAAAPNPVNTVNGANTAHPDGDPDDLTTGQLSLAEKLGLRAPGANHDPAADQNVGPTS